MTKEYPKTSNLNLLEKYGWQPEIAQEKFRGTLADAGSCSLAQEISTEELTQLETGKEMNNEMNKEMSKEMNKDTNKEMNKENDMKLIPARVLAAHRNRYEMVCEHGMVAGGLKAGVYHRNSSSHGESTEEFPTVGDFVMVQYVTSGDSVIYATLPRKSYFSRRDPKPGGHVEQAIAANFDYCFIMSSLNHDFNLGRIERYLTTAWQSGAEPILILTKADLVEDYSKQLDELEGIAPGVPMIPISVISGIGLDELNTYLQPQRTAVFLGSSGVGKSSLVNALLGEIKMDVKGIREDDSRGRHTTTHRELILLPSGAMIIDTPGMRELGMWDVSEGLGEAFADVEEILQRGCRFTDCSHQTEPGCRIKEGLETGELTPQRWKSYLKLKREAKVTADKNEYLRMKHERGKSIAKYSRERNKEWKQGGKVTGK